MSKTILLVDDEESILDILEMNLEREGFKVLRADSGAAAIKELRAGCPDLVLLDVGLPDMNGFEVCRKMRQLAEVYILMVPAARMRTKLPAWKPEPTTTSSNHSAQSNWCRTAMPSFATPTALPRVRSIVSNMRDWTSTCCAAESPIRATSWS